MPTRLYAWTNAQLGALVDTLEGPWNLWLQGWGLQAAGQLLCRPAAPDDAVAGWQPAGHGGDQRAWFAAQAQEAIGQALFALPHPSATGTVAPSVGSAAFADLRSAMAAALELVPADAGLQGDQPATGPWCGCVAVELPLAGYPLRMMLNASCVEAAVPAATAADAQRGTGGVGLVSPEAAMSGQILTLKVELDACELDIGTLQSLRIGDVVPLSHPLDAPARVLAAGDQHVCDAYLGKQGSRKAAELARSRP